MKNQFMTNYDITFITFEEAFKDFFLSKQARNLSKKTLRNYEDAYKYFTAFFDEKHLCKDITPKIYSEYCLFLQEHTKANDVSRQTYLRHLRVILNYCIQNQYMPYFKIELPRAQAKIKAIYTERELSLLLERPNLKKCSFAEYRNWVLVQYLLATGQRLETVRNIKIEDIDLNEQIVFIRAMKDKRQIILPLSTALVLTLKQYLRYRRGQPECYLFCTQNRSKIFFTWTRNSDCKI